MSYLHGQPVVLSPATTYPDFFQTGLDQPRKLALPANVHPQKVRGNFWRYVDYDGDGKTDLIVGADDWTDYGWDNAYDASGKWTHGPLRGFVYLLHNSGTNEQPVYESPVKIQAGDQPLEPSAGHRPTSRTSRAAANSTSSAASFSTASLTSRTSAPAPHRSTRPAAA
ncbi:MAG: FG-GAP repeat protein [Chthoniobacter sp.]